MIPSLRLELTKPNTLEKHMRLKQLLDYAEKSRSGRLSPNQLRHLRAVELLEKMNSAAAKALLQQLAGGAPGARLTEQARNAFERRSAQSRKHNQRE